MSIMFSKRMASGGVGIAAVLAGWFGALPRCFPAAEEARLEFIAMDDGLTRETISALSRPADARSVSVTRAAAPSPSATPAPAQRAVTPPPAATATPVPRAATPAPTPASIPATAPTPPPAAAPMAQPTPAPGSAGESASAGTPSRSRVVIRRHHRRWHHREGEVAQAHPEKSSTPPASRTWMSKFVVWWHGFVDRHFRSKSHEAAS